MSENVRLIDANELIKCLDYCAWNDAVEVVEQQPTAYDVDKVVEQLDRVSDYYECDEQGREHVQMVDLTDAIDIIRVGGKE